METKQIASEIIRILEASPSRQLVGSKLSAALKALFPGFNPTSFGATNLRDFIAQHVTSVFQVGTSGLDPIYGLEPPPAAQLYQSSSKQALSPQRSLELSAWKTFVTPRGGYRLFANPQTRQLRVIDFRSAPPDDPWQQIPAASPQKHREIGREFVESLQDGDEKRELAKYLDSEFWWVPFFELTRRYGLEKRWREFRHQRLRVEYENALQAAGWGKVGPEVSSGSTSQSLSSEKVPHEEDDFVRKIAMLAVQRASLSDLREMRLPLGLVLDALKGR